MVAMMPLFRFSRLCSVVSVTLWILTLDSLILEQSMPRISAVSRAWVNGRTLVTAKFGCSAFVKVPARSSRLGAPKFEVEHFSTANPQGEAPIPDYPTTSEGFVPRYEGPALEDMTEEQRKIRDAIVATRKRTGLSGPFGPWLAVPDIAEPAQALGRACRYGTSLSFRESELVILLTGAKTKSHSEFDIHQGEALRAGLSLEIIQSIPRDDAFSLDAVMRNVVPLLANRREVAMAIFASELLDTYTVSDETYYAMREALGGEDSVLVEITSIVGYYTYVSYTLNAFQIPSKK